MFLLLLALLDHGIVSINVLDSLAGNAWDTKFILSLTVSTARLVFLVSHCCSDHLFGPL